MPGPFGGFSAHVAASEPAPTPLGNLRVLSPSAGIRVSPLFLGGIALGSAWSEYRAASTDEEAFQLLDDFVAAGGCTVDTANTYNDEESEEIIGKWMEARDCRDRMVICTKFTASFQAHKFGKPATVNSGGGSRKSLHISLKESLRKLRTDYIDLLYVHYMDYSISMEELMDSLDAVVKAGKVLYLGISDAPAWFIAGCNSYAKAKGQAQFCMVSPMWNCTLRDVEHEILPMCRRYGLAVSPWAAVGSGKLLSAKQREQLKAAGKAIPGADEKGEISAEQAEYCRVLTEIAVAKGLGDESVVPVALAYLMAKYHLVYPVVAFHNKAQLEDNIRSLSMKLTPEEVKRIDDIKPITPIFPISMIGEDPKYTGKATGSQSFEAGNVDWLVDRSVYQSQLDL